MNHSIAPQKVSALLSLSERVRGPLLAMDTSCPSVSVYTVGWSSEGVEELSLGESAKPSAALAACLDTAFRRHEVEPAQLKGLVIGTGPGSFTGLRVGLSVAKGLALGAGVPLYGISSLALWSGAAGTGLIRPVLDARRGQFFTGLYRVSEGGEVVCIESDRLVEGEELIEEITNSHDADSDVLITGDGAALLELPSSEHYSLVEALPQSYFGLLTLAERIASGQHDEAGSLVPNYLQITEAERQALLRHQ